MCKINAFADDGEEGEEDDDAAAAAAAAATALICLIDRLLGSPTPEQRVHSTFHARPRSPALSPTQVLDQCFRLVCWHATDTQSSDLSTTSQSLKTNGNFPTFGLGDYEDIFLAFLIADAGSENMQSGQFATLFQIIISNSA